jgi:hypothetical protein
MNFRSEDGAFPLKFFLKGGPIYCFRMSAAYAKEAAEAIDSALSGAPTEAPYPPVSCAARLVKQVDGSEMHAVMAAGFAGGVGLSGGVCGALGAAIWALGMHCLEQGVAKNQGELWKSEVFQSRAADIVDGFISAAGEFECAEITGRTFENIQDHAGFIRDGGCTEIIETLAAFR